MLEDLLKRNDQYPRHDMMPPQFSKSCPQSSDTNWKTLTCHRWDCYIMWEVVVVSCDLHLLYSTLSSASTVFFSPAVKNCQRKSKTEVGMNLRAKANTWNGKRWLVPEQGRWFKMTSVMLQNWLTQDLGCAFLKQSHCVKGLSIPLCRNSVISCFTSSVTCEV